MDTINVDGFVLLEDSANENYYDLKYMIMIIRYHKIRIYPNGPEDSTILLEFDLKDIIKVVIVKLNWTKL